MGGGGGSKSVIMPKCVSRKKAQYWAATKSKPKTIVGGKLDFVYISFKQIVIIG